MTPADRDASATAPPPGAPAPAGTVTSVPWQLVRPMADQPREHFDQAKLAELASSIAAVGQVVPAKVARVREDRKGRVYELIDGQRRWHAVQMAGLPTLKVEVVDEPDEERRYILSVVANLSREDHHPLEIAVACDRLRRTMSVEKVAAAIGKSYAYVINHLAVLRLHPTLKELLHPKGQRDHSKRLPMTSAVLLAKLDPPDQLIAWERMKATKLSAGAAARLVVETERPTRRDQPRGTRDKFRTYGNCFRTCAAQLENRRGKVADMVPGRYPQSIAQVREDLQRIIAAAGDILDEWDEAVAASRRETRAS